MSIEAIDVVVDEGVGSVYLGLNRLESGELETAGVTHTMEKHGLLLHWNGHGKLAGIEVIATGRPVRIRETNAIEDEIPDHG
jgi:hypothetical protein